MRRKLRRQVRRWTGLAEMAGDLIAHFNDLLNLSMTLRAYLNGFTSVDSYNLEARRLELQFQVQSARLDELTTRFRSWVGQGVGPAAGND